MPDRRLLSATLVLSLVAACSQPDAGSERGGREATDPPGVAEALSLSSTNEVAEATPYDRAVDCAVALAVTARVLAPMTSGAKSREVQAINTAAQRYRERAATAPGGGNVRADIERRTGERAQDRQGQAQRSIACLRALEDAA